MDSLTDSQVTALCPNGNPPEFIPTKRATRDDPHAADEKRIRGSRGGTVHVARNADAAHILEVCKATDADIARDFAASWIGGKRPQPIRLNGFDASTLAEVQRLIGVAPRENQLAMTGGDLRHGFRKHGQREKFRKQAPVTAQDVARLPGILNDHDTIEAGNGGMRNHRFYPSVKVTKEYNGKKLSAVFLVGEYIWPKTFWKER